MTAKEQERIYDICELAAETPRLAGAALPVTINSYRVLERVGRGGMGLVYRAVDTELDRQVALKFLPAGVELDDEARASLVNEARAASALDHPNIETIYAIEETASGRPFIVMAYYEGQTLEEKLRQGPLPANEAAAIALQVASGLAEAHAHQIVHRDIKPSNIFLTRQGVAKIVDFGIARVIRSAKSTRSAHISGTAAYMSPEQAKGQFLDARTDLWSLGAVLYEMVAGRPPFAEDDLPATLYSIVNAPPPELAEATPALLRMTIYRALAKRPEDRYHSAAAIIQDLRQVSGAGAAGGDPTVTMEEVDRYRERADGRPQAAPWRRRLRWLLGLPLVLIAALVLSLVHQRPPHPAAYESYLQAQRYLQRYERPQNMDRAITLLGEAVRADPNFALAFASLGEAYSLKARLTKDHSLLAQAEANARRALALNDASPQGHIVMGGVQSALGNRELAQEEFQRALRLEPSNADALFGLAREYVARQRLAEAENLYRRAAALRPDSWEGYNNLGIFLKTRRQPKEAAQQFRRVIQLTPDNAAGYLNLAAVLIDDGKLDDAETALKEALQRIPSSYAAYTNLGALYYRKQQYTEAAEATSQALRLNDRDWHTWMNLAVIQRWLSHDQEAVAAYRRAMPLLEQAVNVDPQNASLQARLAETYAYSGDRDRAESRIRAALALGEQDDAVLLSCADAYAAMGDRSRAVALAKQAVAHGLTPAQLDQDPEARGFRNDPQLNSPQ